MIRRITNFLRRRIRWTKQYLMGDLSQIGLPLSTAHRMRPTFFYAISSAVVAAGVLIVHAAESHEIQNMRTDLSDKDLKRVEQVVQPAKQFETAEKFEAKSGGATTSTKAVNRDSFSQFSDNLSFEGEQDFKLGNALFRKLWVSSPSSTQASDGLGPLFNARACQSCHLKDGRGHPPEGDTDATSMFLRLARPAETQNEIDALKNFVQANFPDPTYGGQLQDLAVPGIQSEGRMVIQYDVQIVALGDGSEVSLRKPSYSVADLGFGPLHPENDTLATHRAAHDWIGVD